jgi:uncharacterized protein YigA (DUF484 family)
MNEQPSEQDLSSAVDELLVSEYLAQHPEFFQNHPELLAEIRLPHRERGTVSLTERQLSLLRQQNQQLKEEITELMSVAARNEKIFRVYSQLYNDLLGCQQINEVQPLLQRHLAEQLGLPVVALRLFDYGNDRQLALLRDDAEHVLTRRLAGCSCYFGRLAQQEQWLLFGDNRVESAALLLIGDPGSVHGILAIGSHDADHFAPDMDSLLVDQLRALLSTLLPRLLAGNA